MPSLGQECRSSKSDDDINSRIAVVVRWALNKAPGRQADRQMGTEADRQAGRQADTQTGKCAGRQTNRQTGKQALLRQTGTQVGK